MAVAQREFPSGIRSEYLPTRIHSHSPLKVTDPGCVFRRAWVWLTLRTGEDPRKKYLLRSIGMTYGRHGSSSAPAIRACTSPRITHMRASLCAEAVGLSDMEFTEAGLPCIIHLISENQIGSRFTIRRYFTSLRSLSIRYSKPIESVLALVFAPKSENMTATTNVSDLACGVCGNSTGWISRFETVTTVADPEFVDEIGNITIAAGRNVKLACSVKNLGPFKDRLSPRAAVFLSPYRCGQRESSGCPVRNVCLDRAGATVYAPCSALRSFPVAALGAYVASLDFGQRAGIGVRFDEGDSSMEGLVKFDAGSRVAWHKLSSGQEVKRDASPTDERAAFVTST
ncbi:hypothetical protein KM043_000657 [Ampulex compressa]|nr:hypothetical protein KM043_000657 [Ampulex compressa]